MKQEILDVMQAVINTFDKGCACTIVQEKVATDKEFNKGRGANKNPYLDGRLTIRNTFSGYVMGTDYAQSLANAHERITGDTMTANEVDLKKSWNVAFPSTEKYDFSGWFDKKRSEPNGEETTVYLKIQRNEKQIAHKTTTTYYLYGKEVTNEKVLAEIEAWKKQKSVQPSSTQREVGMTKETMQHYKLLDLRTITMVKQGTRVLNVGAILRG